MDLLTATVSVLIVLLEKAKKFKGQVQYLAFKIKNVSDFLVVGPVLQFQNSFYGKYNDQ